jgi:hypothetical protein
VSTIRGTSPSYTPSRPAPSRRERAKADWIEAMQMVRDARASGDADIAALERYEALCEAAYSEATGSPTKPSVWDTQQTH